MSMTQFWGILLAGFFACVSSFWFGRYIERVDPMLKRRLVRIGYLITGNKDGQMVRWFTLDGHCADVHVDEKRSEGYTCLQVSTVYRDTRDDEECEK